MTTRLEAIRGIEREFAVLLRRVRRVIGERARMVHPDLQPASYLMLTSLDASGPRRASAVVEEFGIDKGAVSRQTHQLVELGLLERTPDPSDGRATLLSVTTDAHQRLARVQRLRSETLRRRLSDWSDEDLMSFAADLARYNASLEG